MEPFLFNKYDDYREEIKQNGTDSIERMYVLFSIGNHFKY